MKYFLITSACLFSIFSKAQNVGVGTAAPLAKLHVVTSGGEPLRVQGSNPYISFFNGTDYSGYLWYNTNRMQLGTPVGSGEPVVISASGVNTAYFTSAGNVGVNIAAPTEKLDVNGNINLRGVLKIDGSAGASGQVYVTGGPSLNPTWKTLALANTTRFAFDVTGSGYNTALSYSSNYNTNTADVTMGLNSFTINKTGLYHFDAFFKFTASYTGTYTQASAPQLTVSIVVGGDSYFGTAQQDLEERIYYVGGFNKYFYMQTKFSYDIYVTAGQTITLSRSFAGQPSPANFDNRGLITGYLISE